VGQAKVVFAAVAGLLLTTLLVMPALAAGLAGGDDAAPSGASGATVLAQEDADQGLIFGTLRGDDGPVEGAEVQVTDAGGDEVGTAVTAESGRWEVEVPEGDYVVTVTSLPEGIELRDPEEDSQEVSVSAGGQQAVAFRLGSGGAVSGRVALFAQQTLSGIRFGLIIAMTAIGLSLVFGTTGLINFAHGEMVIFGAIVAWFLNATGPGLPLLVAGALAVVASAGLGLAIDRGMFRPLRRRNVGLFQLLVVTIGLSLVLRFSLLIWYGGRTRRYTDFVGQPQLTFGPFGITTRDLIITIASIGVLLLVAAMLQRTRLGKAMRAVADNRDLSESSGIDVERVVSMVWLLGGALAGLGGVLYGTMLGVNYISGFQILLLMFAGVILGGLGTAYGAMVGSLVVGLITELSVVFFPDEIKYAWALGVLVVVLLVRPQGILGQRERVG